MKNIKRLIVFYGPPCAGKSTLSKLLAAKLNAKRISIDNVRRKIFANKISFSKETNQKIFKKFLNEINQSFEKEDLVICEALFISDERKRGILDLPVKCYNIIYVTAPEEILQKRLIERKINSNCGSHELVSLIGEKNINQFYRLSNMPKKQGVIVDTSSSDVKESIKEINDILLRYSFSKKNLLDYF